MEHQTAFQNEISSYKEVEIGGTLYRITGLCCKQDDLGRLVERIALRHAAGEALTPITADLQGQKGVENSSEPVTL